MQVGLSISDHAEDMEEGSCNDYLAVDTGTRTPSRGLAAFRLVQAKVPRCAREVASGVKMRFLSQRASPWSHARGGLDPGMHAKRSRATMVVVIRPQRRDRPSSARAYACFSDPLSDRGGDVSAR